jgi:hypothetical protein
VDPSVAKVAAERARQEKAHRENEARMFRDFETADVPTHFETDCGIAVLGAYPQSVDSSRGQVERDPNRPDIWFPIYVGDGPFGLDWANVLVELDSDRHAYVCAVKGFIATLQMHNENRASVVHRPLGQDPAADMGTIDVLARANAGLLSSADIVDSAARLREAKHTDFTMGCVAAHLYDSIRDADSITSIAAYYAGYGQIVPLDVALLSGGVIFADAGKLYVEIPATSQREPRTELEAKRRFTFDATPYVERALIGGSAPWMRSGWTAIATARFHDSALEWRERAERILRHLTPAPFTIVRKEGREVLADLIGVRLLAEA